MNKKSLVVAFILGIIACNQQLPAAMLTTFINKTAQTINYKITYPAPYQCSETTGTVPAQSSKIITDIPACAAGNDYYITVTGGVDTKYARRGMLRTQKQRGSLTRTITVQDSPSVGTEYIISEN